jgi:hypothetical protein
MGSETCMPIANFVASLEGTIATEVLQEDRFTGFSVGEIVSQS